jgi:hypothetical protein
MDARGLAMAKTPLTSEFIGFFRWIPCFTSSTCRGISRADLIFRVGGSMSRLFSTLGLLGLLVLAGCGGSMGKMGASSEQPVKIPLHVIVNSAYFVNEVKQSLYERIRGGESVPFGEITQALVKDQYANWIDRHKDTKNPPTVNDFYKTIQELGANLPSDDLGEIKKEIDSRLAAKLGGPLLYNSQAASVMDVVQERKVQNYSGTMLLMLTLREAWGRDKFQNSGLVAIYESGHVLPGIVTKVDGVWYLVGIETTVSGTGRVLYGPLAEAVKTRMLRIVDADLFSVLELFKFEADNVVDFANEALTVTATKLTIADPPLLISKRFRREGDFGKIAWSPLGFGSIDIGQGDRERATLDESKRDKLPRANPNITIIHKPEATPTTPPAKEIKPVPSLSQFSAYPYREVKANNAEGKSFECWDYSKRVWVTMPYQKVDDEYLISYHPCAYSRPGTYEELPAPLRLNTRGTDPAGPGGYGPYYGRPYGPYSPRSGTTPSPAPSPTPILDPDYDYDDSDY